MAGLDIESNKFASFAELFLDLFYRCPSLVSACYLFTI